MDLESGSACAIQNSELPCVRKALSAASKPQRLKPFRVVLLAASLKRMP